MTSLLQFRDISLPVKQSKYTAGQIGKFRENLALRRGLKRELGIDKIHRGPYSQVTNKNGFIEPVIPRSPFEGDAMQGVYDHLKERYHFMSAKQRVLAFADPRPRNGLGEFSPDQSEGPNPMSMRKTYRQGLIQGAVEGGAAGLAGAGAVAGIGHLAEKLKNAKK